MSKAFDTVKRNNLMELLETIFDPDETHMMKIILKDLKLSVRIGKEFGEKITTNIGVPREDCLSPILFTLYLADALKTERSTITEEHNYSKILMNSEDLLQEHLKDTGWVAANAKHRTEKNQESQHSLTQKKKKKKKT